MSPLHGEFLPDTLRIRHELQNMANKEDCLAFPVDYFGDVKTFDQLQQLIPPSYLPLASETNNELEHSTLVNPWDYLPIFEVREGVSLCGLYQRYFKRLLFEDGDQLH